jgi:hypothetical protein
MNRETGNMTFESIEEKVHDDLVVSLAMCLWYAETRAPVGAFGRVHSEIAPQYNPLTGRQYGKK